MHGDDRGFNSVGAGTEHPSALEGDAQPPLFTSGQLLGALVKQAGLNGHALDTKTARRYFNGQRVKDSSKAEILAGLAKALVELGLIPKFPIGFDSESSLGLVKSALLWHAASWDRLRSHLRRRMARVQLSRMNLVWVVYLRLAVIDLALRAAGALHAAGADPSALQMLDRLDRSQRGWLLNQRRSAAGVPLERLAEQVGVTGNAVDGWMYHGVRPSEQNLAALAEALSVEGGAGGQANLLAELRRFYWASDLIELLKESLGSEAVENLLGRLRAYAELAISIIEGMELDQAEREAVAGLTLLGSNASIAGGLLGCLAAKESDEEWRAALIAISGDWTRWVLTAIYRIDQEEVAAIDQATGGGLLQSWDVSSPEAYKHYQKSIELQIQGRTTEALREVAKAIELDPLDPVPHCTMGSVVAGIGNKRRDATMVKRGLEECRIAASLDLKQLLPWTEIGYILIEAGRPGDALTHLLNVHKDREPLDARYYMALASAHRDSGNYSEALAAFEQGIQLDPEDVVLVIGAGVVAAMKGDKLKVARYVKEAQHLGEVGITRELLTQTAEAAQERMRHPMPPLI